MPPKLVARWELTQHGPWIVHAPLSGVPGLPLRAMVKYGLLLAIVVAAVGLYGVSRLDFNRLRPMIAESVKEATGRDFEIAGALRLGFGLTPIFVVEDVRLHNAVFGTRAEMIKARKLEAHLALLPLLRGRIEISRLVLVGPDILLETDEQGRSNWDFSREDDPAPVSRPETAEEAALELPNLSAVRIDNGLLTYRNGITGKTTKIAISRFDGESAGLDAPLEIHLTATYDGIPFRVAGRLGAFATLGSPGPFPVDLNAEMSDVQLALKGVVNRPLAPASSKVSVSINSKNLKALGDLIKVPLPLETLAFSGQMTADPSGLTLTAIKARLGDSDLQGRLRLAPGKARWQITASLQSHHLDLADFAVAETTADNGAKANSLPKDMMEDGRLFSDMPLPFDILELIDGTVDAKIDALTLGRLKLNRAELTAKLHDGQLKIEPLSGVLAEGHLKGGMTLASADHGAAKIDLHLLGIDLSSLSEVFDTDEILSGKADLMASVSGHGRSLRAMMSSLDGRASVVMGKGLVKSSYADLVGADLLRFAATAGPTETTTVNCLVGRFDIAKGIASSRDILFDTGQMTVKGEGGINLINEQLDLDFTPNAKQSLVDLSVPWRVEGRLLKPEVSVDELGLAGTLLTAINPLSLLVPLVSDSSDDENPCLAALAGGQKSDAPAGRESAKPISQANGVRQRSDRE